MGLDDNKVAEDKDDETQQSKMAAIPPEKFVSKFSSCRWQIVYMCMMCSLLLFAFRLSFNFSIVCMEYTVTEYVNVTVMNSTTGLNETGKVTETKIVNPYVPMELRGLVLSCYFYGYTLTPLIGGYLGAKVGPKLMIGVAMTVSIVITILLPIGFRFNIYLIVALRFIMGFFSGCVLPSMQVLLSNWSPILERTQLAAVSNSGVNIGNIFATFVSGFLCTIPVDGGWPLPFYAYGSLGAVWLVLWMYLVFDTPDQHPRCSLREKQRIYHGKTALKAAKKALPWRRTLKNMPFWSLVVNHVAFSWITNTIQTFLPIYMSDVLRFQITENGILSSLPSIGRFFGSLIFSFLADRIIRTTSMGVAANRKTFQTFGTVIPGCLLIGLSFLDSEQRILAVALITLTMTLQAFTTASYRVNHLDIAPRYAGQVMGFTLTCGSCSAIISPLVTSALTMERTREQWQLVFFLTAGIVIAADVVFVIFASGHEQDWAKDDDNPSENERRHQATVKEPETINDVISFPSGSKNTSNVAYDPNTICNDKNQKGRYKTLNVQSEGSESNIAATSVLGANEITHSVNGMFDDGQREQSLHQPSYRYNLPTESSHIDSFSDIFVTSHPSNDNNATAGMCITNCDCQEDASQRDTKYTNTDTCTTHL